MRIRAVAHVRECGAIGIFYDVPFVFDAPENLSAQEVRSRAIDTAIASGYEVYCVVEWRNITEASK